MSTMFALARQSRAGLAPGNAAKHFAFARGFSSAASPPKGDANDLFGSYSDTAFNINIRRGFLLIGAMGLFVGTYEYDAPERQMVEAYKDAVALEKLAHPQHRCYWASSVAKDMQCQRRLGWVGGRLAELGAVAGKEGSTRVEEGTAGDSGKPGKSEKLDASQQQHAREIEQLQLFQKNCDRVESMLTECQRRLYNMLPPPGKSLSDQPLPDPFGPGPGAVSASVVRR